VVGGEIPREDVIVSSYHRMSSIILYTALLNSWRGIATQAFSPSLPVSSIANDWSSRTYTYDRVSMTGDDKDKSSTIPFAQIYDKTLVSIRDCIDVQKETSNNSKVVFVDGSWYHRVDPIIGLFRNPSQEYIDGRIPNARYLDIDEIAMTHELFPESNKKSLPHMMPPSRLFGLAMDAYDIQNEDHVIIYARRGALFTPRVWFLFISMGHSPKRVHLMQGSLEDYRKQGGLVETGQIMTSDSKQQSMGQDYMDCFDNGILNVTRLFHKYYDNTIPHYKSNDSATNVCGKEEVLDAVNKYLKNDSAESKGTVILDTRGSGYKKKGYMPSAIHLPYTQIASPNNALAIQPKEELKKLFEDRGVDYLNPELKIILSCGSGV